MKEHRVGEDAVEVRRGQVERKEILLQTSHPEFARAISAKVAGTVQTDRRMAHGLERLQVAPRPAAEVEDRKGRRAVDVPQQRLDVVADVVVARAFAERLRPW